MLNENHESLINIQAYLPIQHADFSCCNSKTKRTEVILFHDQMIPNLVEETLEKYCSNLNHSD